MSWAYKLLARGGKLLARAGKGIVLTDAAKSAIEDCCCGSCDAESCCVLYHNLPATIRVTLSWPIARITRYVPAGPLAIVAALQPDGVTYRGDVHYVSRDGLDIEGVFWFAGVNSGSAPHGSGASLDVHVVGDPDDKDGWSGLWPYYYCDGLEYYYGVRLPGRTTTIWDDWEGDYRIKADWDTGMTCCGPCPCNLFTLSGPWGWWQMEAHTIPGEGEGGAQCAYYYAASDGAASYLQGTGLSIYWQYASGHWAQGTSDIICVDGVPRVDDGHAYDVDTYDPVPWPNVSISGCTELCI